MTPVDPRVALTFARRERGTTHWLEIEYPATAEPTDMLNDLAICGWTADGMQVPEYEARDAAFNSLGYMVREVHITGPRGSGLFGEWNFVEKRINMANARSVLRKYGFTRAPIWTKTLQDML